MKFFFHSAIASSAGEDVSSLAVKNKIRGLIEAEDAAHPLSDARLAELLAREGIQIARRTVAKYREELRIAASSIRRIGAPPPPPPARPDVAVPGISDASAPAGAPEGPSEEEEP
jgi:RNA polymerase sigma-54 factor